MERKDGTRRNHVKAKRASCCSGILQPGNHAQVGERRGGSGWKGEREDQRRRFLVRVSAGEKRKAMEKREMPQLRLIDDYSLCLADGIREAHWWHSVVRKFCPTIRGVISDVSHSYE